MLRAAAPARVLAMEYDRLGALSTAMGRKPGFDPAQVAPGLWTVVLDGAHQLEEYLATVVPSRAMLKAVVNSGAYRYFVEAAPGLRELIMVGKIYHELEYRPPVAAVGHGRARRARVGPGAQRAADADWWRARLSARESSAARPRASRNCLRDPARCGVVLVTSAEPFAVSETLETHAALRSLGLDVAAVIFNRTRRPRFDANAVARLARRPALRAAAPHLDGLAALAHAELKRAAGERRALELVRRRIGAPIIELAECRGAGGLALMRELARQLAHQRAGEARAHAPSA